MTQLNWTNGQRQRNNQCKKILILSSWKIIWFHSTITRRGSRPVYPFYRNWSNLKWKIKRKETSWYKNCSPYERESKKVLDSGFHTVDSGFKVMHSDSLSLELGFRIPELNSAFQSRGFRIAPAKNPGFWIPQVKKFTNYRVRILFLGRNCEEKPSLGFI